MGRAMIGFWPEFDGAACYAALASFQSLEHFLETITDDVLEKKEYDTYQINKIQVNVFNVKFLGDIATRRNQKKTWMLENSKKGKKVNQAELLLPYSSRFTATSSKFKNLNHDFLIFLYFFPNFVHFHV
ncbi:Protein CBG20990 [Caenorhabditis briggsae]|uniref:Protein CBG20990 n=1 Tax=Caenorhabditis briggsae TaxID=6238 RepID=A8XZ43_CAEBR|nr:Protein CBG20990 [Caenorhabditis briggsae]CAP37910.1 Protein CBG20990 [Caenorhabditis briggsae]